MLGHGAALLSGSDRNKTSRADRSHRRRELHSQEPQPTLTLFSAAGSIGSLGAPPAISSAWQNPALHTRLGIQLGGEVYDSLTVPGINSYETTLETNGIPFTTDMVIGGHEW